jgi:uncharacterized phosphatase
MTTTTLALVRHGQTDWNAEGRMQGRTDIPLNEIGRAQARNAVEVLSGQQWDVIVSSPLSRAAETADLIAAGLGMTVKQRVEELTERNFGPAEGLQSGPELDALRVPGGFRDAETEAQAAARGLAAFDELARQYPGARVVVVTHGTLIRVSLSEALGRTMESVTNASLNLVHRHDDGWTLEYYNGELVPPTELDADALI